MRGALALTVLVASSGCTTESPPADPVPCPAGVLGDMSKPVDFDIIAVDANFDTVALANGGTISLIQPPQGGRVLFVGVRATNVDGCGLSLTGALRDDKTQQVRFDTRTINLIPTGDGWGVTGMIGANVSGLVSNFSNVPVCANSWSTSNVNGSDYGLEVTITDRGGRTLEKTIHVVPVCDTPDDAVDCACLCRADYDPAMQCPAPGDGGDD